MRRPMTVVGVCLFAAAVCSAAYAEDSGSASRKLTLKEALALAEQRNPSLKIAAAEVLRAEALVIQSRSSSLPMVTGNLGFTRLDDARRFGGQIFIPQDETNGSLVVSVPIIEPQKWAAWAHSLDNKKVAELSAAEIRRQVAIAVGHAYLNVIAAKRQVELSERARDTARAHYDLAHTRLKGGAGSRLDEARAAQELATDEALVEGARVARTRAEEALGVLIGLETPIDTAEEPSFEIPPDVAGTDLLARRPDLRMLAQKEIAARHVKRDDWTDYAPSLEGVYQRLYQNPPSITQPFWSWQEGLFISVPLFEGGVRYGLARERTADLLEAQANLEGAVRQARADLRAAIETVDRSSAAFADASEAARRAHDALDMTNLAYRAGATTNFEVIDAERRARDADTGRSLAKNTLQQARLDLLATAGKFP
jgi:outer membrane protein TolC